PPPPSSPFPYTTLFRSKARADVAVDVADKAAQQQAGSAGQHTADHKGQRHDTTHRHPAQAGGDRVAAGGIHALSEGRAVQDEQSDRKSTRLNSSHVSIS